MQRGPSTVGETGLGCDVVVVDGLSNNPARDVPLLVVLQTAPRRPAGSPASPKRVQQHDPVRGVW